ncbi:hypothetical protein NIES25_32170 [Nostoc linckia NIES-25]|nr:hypothetical protein NIES25_32170 [Nostoc linckia NIES-25]
MFRQQNDEFVNIPKVFRQQNDEFVNKSNAFRQQNNEFVNKSKVIVMTMITVIDGRSRFFGMALFGCGVSDRYNDIELE